jgi:hypothetical protein
MRRTLTICFAATLAVWGLKAMGATQCPTGQFMFAFAQPPSSCANVSASALGPFAARILLGTQVSGNAVAIPMGNEFVFSGTTLHITPPLVANFGGL